MPIYVYECVKCSHSFELVQKVGEGNENIECPKCGEPKPKKLVTTFRTHGWSEFIDKMEKRISPHKFK